MSEQGYVWIRDSNGNSLSKDDAIKIVESLKKIMESPPDDPDRIITDADIVEESSGARSVGVSFAAYGNQTPQLVEQWITGEAKLAVPTVTTSLFTIANKNYLRVQFTDRHERGYIRVTGFNDKDQASDAAKHIMETASFQVTRGLVVRSDVFQDPNGGFVIYAPFVAYSSGDVAHIKDQVEKAAQAKVQGVTATHSVVLAYHGNPQEDLPHLGRSEKSQPGNRHGGNSWG
jgi:hypothetical protein